MILAAVIAFCSPGAADCHPGAGIVVTPSGRIYFLDAPGGAMWMLEPGQDPVLISSGTAKLSHPHHLLLDGDANLYTCTDGSGEIWKFPAGGGDPALFYPPERWPGVGFVGFGGDPFTIDKQGAVHFVNERYGKTSQVLKVDLAGKLSVVAGGDSGFADGKGDQAKFRSLHFGAMVWGADGWLYLSDGGVRIRKIGPDGIVQTLAGGETAGFADGSAEDARFFVAMGLAFDNQGNLLVADAGNRRIRKVTPEGNVTTIAGSGLAGSMDGTAATATFEFPSGIAIGGDAIYVLDSSAREATVRVRRISSGGIVDTVASVASPDRAPAGR